LCPFFDLTRPPFFIIGATGVGVTAIEALACVALREDGLIGGGAREAKGLEGIPFALSAA
jgi:hypothetical protein